MSNNFIWLWLVLLKFLGFTTRMLFLSYCKVYVSLLEATVGTRKLFHKVVSFCVYFDLSYTTYQDATARKRGIHLYFTYLSKKVMGASFFPVTLCVVLLLGSLDIFIAMLTK